MADPISMAAISATFQLLFEKVLNTLSTYTHHEYRLLLGGDDQGVHQALEKLKDTLTRFRTMVRDDELKIFKNKETRDWHGSVRCAVNEADINLEEPLQSDSDDRHQQRVCNPFPTLFEFSVRKRNKFAERIASLLQKFESLEVQRGKLNFDEINLSHSRETISTSDEVVFGRNEEKEKTVKFLLSDTIAKNDNSPRIYAIIGLGGIGKTTLARLICNDKRVEDNFEPIIWVWVSQSFDVKKLMEKIIETHSKETRTFESLETTKNHLTSLLRGKKFLLVLDDMWNEKQEEWDKLKAPLNFGAFGSSILLTTRGADVASTVGAHQHRLGVLSEDQCWKVFKESACLEGNEENGMLKVIGKEIAKKCGGLPLAAKSLGGSLRLTREVRMWKSVRDSEIWELQEPGILPALKLSLDSLNSHAKDCFAFCCVFPKGYKMDKELLIQLWMANDFLPSHNILEPEDMGNQIFSELALKSFFEVSLGKGDVKMHDLMHDLAFSIGNKGYCWKEDTDLSKIPLGVLHLSWHSSTTNNLDTLSKCLPSLRTCILEDTSRKCDFPNEIKFKNLDFLRALDLNWKKIHNLPASIGKTRHLKYLSLSNCTDVTHLPDPICTLTKLQTLKLMRLEGLTQLPDSIVELVNLRHLYIICCYRLTHLPDGIESLTNLRRLELVQTRELKQLPDGISQLFNLEHLYISGCYKLTQMSNNIGRLVNLRTLGFFVVDEQIGRRITELQGIDQLCGSLEIRGLEHVRDRGEAESVFLKSKTNLSSLELIWGDSQVSNSITDEAKVEVEDVLEALRPPPRLNEKLVIEGYGGSVFPSWMGLLQNLVRIELRNCVKCEHLPPLGQLPLLKFLAISEMESLEYIGAEFYGSNNSSGERRCAAFPSLEELEFYSMRNLKEWQDLETKEDQHTGPFPCLKRLEIEHCPALQSVPVMRSSVIVEVRIYKCQSLKSLSQNLQYLSTLKSLSVWGCDQLELSREDFQGLISLKFLDISCLPKLTFLPRLPHLFTLKRLSIWNCEQLELSSADFQGLNSLEELCLWSLAKLTSLPRLQHLSTLKRLDIRNYGKLELSSADFQGLNSLQELCLWSLAKLTSLPRLQHLSMLKRLSIRNYGQLELSSADFQGLISLESLNIFGLLKLTSLSPLQHLSTVKELWVCGCKNVIRLWPRDGNNLTAAAAALETLCIENCEQLELLVSDFQHLIKVRKIELHNLPKLTTSLPELHHLHSLKDLTIRDCKNLRVLPQGLHNLTSLERLWIEGCHGELHSRCEKNTGNYWPSIKHIRTVNIGEPWPTTSEVTTPEETPPITPKETPPTTL